MLRSRRLLVFVLAVSAPAACTAEPEDDLDDAASLRERNRTRCDGGVTADGAVTRNADAGIAPAGDAGGSSVDAASPSDGGGTAPEASLPANSASCTKDVWNNLEACGWPGPNNTGYPAGTTFGSTITSGLTITVDGTVIDGARISGGIRVRAKNVVIRNSWVTQSAGGASGSGVVVVEKGASATIERTKLDGQDATHACIWHEGAGMIARYVDCSGVNDGVFFWTATVGVSGTGDNFTVERSYLHGFTEDAANGHVDGIQTEGASHGVIRHNTIDVTQSQTSAIAIWNGRANSDDILVDDNLMAGGGFAVYVEDYSPSEASPAGGFGVTNVRLTNNKFSTVHYGCVGHWGVWYSRGAPTDGWKRSGNVVLETGQSVDSNNPTYKGSPCN